MDLRSKIAISGFGIEGKAMFNWLQKHDFRDITVCDQDVNLDYDFPSGISTRLGEEYLNDLDKFDVIFRSPGISFLNAHVRVAAEIEHIKVTSVTKFFMDQCPCPVIGVSGTKGKGTTCTLIHNILKSDGRDAHLGGNIGTPPVEFLDDLEADSIVVLEMSSFQLQDALKSPHYAVLLNTTEDHLDYHADVGEYRAAKEGLLTHQNENGLAVLNKDYDYAKQYESLVKGRMYWVSVEGKVDGAYVEDGVIYWQGEEVCKVEDVALLGSHNLENILPAVAICSELGISRELIGEEIRAFEGLPHHLEFVRELRGIKYYNDSFSTNDMTCMAAVDSFDESMILICGGFDKGLDYGDWATKILTKINLHVVILIGDTADKMEEALIEAEEQLGEAMGSPTKVLRRDSLEDCVVDAMAESEDEGVVVFSPAASSFDSYKNYKERGKQFMREVKKLK